MSDASLDEALLKIGMTAGDSKTFRATGFSLRKRGYSVAGNKTCVSGCL